MAEGRIELGLKFATPLLEAGRLEGGACRGGCRPRGDFLGVKGGVVADLQIVKLFEEGLGLCFCRMGHVSVAKGGK